MAAIMRSHVGRNDPCPCGSGKKYKKCHLGRVESGPPTSDQTGVFSEIRQAMDEQEFSSMAEIQAFTKHFMQQRNRTPREEFHGLSPEQMHRFLHFPFTSPELATFPDTLAAAPDAKILILFVLIAAAIGDQGMKPTAKGNLPRKFCREAALTFWGEETYRQNTRFGGINREDDFSDLHVTREVAEMAA